MGRCFSKVRASHTFVERRASHGDYFHWTSMLSNIISDNSDSETDEYACKTQNMNDSDDDLNFPDDEECVIVCEEKCYPIKTRALCKSSSYFKAMFSCHMRESLTKRVELKEIEPRIVEMVIKYVESAVFPVLTDEDDLLAVLSVSHMYLFNDLYDYCCDCVKDVINFECYEQFWNLSKLHENEHLLETIVDYFTDEFFHLKDSIMCSLSFEEISWMVKKLIEKQIIPVNEIELFIVDWINDDLIYRERFSLLLLFLCDLHQLDHNNLNCMLKETTICSKPIFNVILEKYSYDHIKIYLMNRYYNIWFYSLRSGKWLRLKDNFSVRTKIEKICGSVGDYIYVFKYEFLPKMKDLLHIYKWNVYNKHIQELPVLEIDRYILCDFCSAVNDNDVFVIYKSIAQNSPCTRMYYYASNSNQWRTLQMKHTYSSIDSLIAVQNNLFVYGKDSSNKNVIQRYSILSQQWYSVKCPPIRQGNEHETALSYLDDFYVIRHSQVVEQFIWKIGSPKPVRLINKQREAKYHIKYTDRCTETLCEVLSKKMRLLKYNMQNDTWKEISTTETPTAVVCILNGPWSPTIRNPCIYIIGDDFHLYQFDPRGLEWKNLYEFPRSVILSNYYSVIVPTIGY